MKTEMKGFMKRFQPRETKPRYQVRFWSTKKKYEKFKKHCEKKNLIVQDVFNELMDLFIDEY